jgi:hypothetical protein
VIILKKSWNPALFSKVWNKVRLIASQEGTQPEGEILADNSHREEPRFFTPDVLWLALVTLLWYFLSYIRLFGVAANNEIYWFGWSDQTRYLETAIALSNFSLPAHLYVYPLGYPLLGSLFVRFLPKHAFLIPNLICTLGIVLTFYAACKTQLTKLESFGLCLFLILASAFLSNKLLFGGLIWENALFVPWNTIPVFFAAYLTTYLIVFNVATTRRLWLASIAIGVAFFCRPWDVVFLFIIYLAVLLDRKTVRSKVHALVIFAVPLTVFAGIALASKLIIFGHWLSPYDVLNARIGFNFSDLPYKFYLVMLDASPIHQYTDTMLGPQMPWLLLVVPGVIVLSRATRNKAYFLVLSISACYIFYISFNGMAPTNVFTYHGYHYLAWTFPWLGFFAYISVTRAAQKLGARKMIWCTLPVFAIVLIIGWHEVPIFVYSVDRGSPEADGNSVEKVYSPSERRFMVKIQLREPREVNGIRFSFPKNFSKNLREAGNWLTVNVEADGKLLNLYSDYNLYQIGHEVTISPRNAMGRNGRINSLQVVFNGIDEPTLGRVTLLQKRFQAFGFARQMMMKLGFAPLEWQMSTDNVYHYGEALSFSAGGNSQPYKLAGWGSEEQEYSWTDGNRATLGFWVSSTSQDILLTTELAGLISPPRLNYQPVKVLVNDQQVAEWEVSGRKTFTARIPNSLIGKNNILKIQLEVPMATQPYQLGMGLDKRKLGVACYNMLLAPAN